VGELAGAKGRRAPNLGPADRFDNRSPGSGGLGESHPGIIVATPEGMEDSLMPDSSEKDALPERLRPPPSERFAGPSHVFALHEQLASLRAEKAPTRDGHRQMTLFQRPPVTQVLFAFEEGGRMPSHQADGLVTIHVLEGRLTVQAEGQAHHLTPGGMLILRPGVPHDVQAVQASAMLLTVHMERTG
jgi:quercetin dioxygenase-like cupin family protein